MNATASHSRAAPLGRLEAHPASGGALSDLVDVGPIEDFPPDTPLQAVVDDQPVCLVNLDGTVHAIHDVCSHAEESLAGGWVDEDRIECPRHGAAFSLLTGEALTPPANLPVPTFRVVVEEGRVLVDPTPSHPHPLLQRKEYGELRG